LLDECEDRGVSVIAAAPYNSGLLARDRPLSGATFDYGPAGSDRIAAAHRLADTCERHGVTLPAAALRFPLRHRSVAAVVAGFSSAAEVADAIGRLSATVPEALWPELQDPGPP